MGLVSFVKDAGRKVGLFGGAKAAEAQKAAQEAQDAAQAAAAAQEQAEREALARRALQADIAAAIASHGVQVEGLQVAISNDVVRLTGTASSQADAEKAVLIAGNTAGVAAVDDQIAVVVPEPPAVYHTVVAGDTLSKISLAVYGNMQLYDVIFDANRPMLEHPDKIYPGQVLRIPSQVPPMVHEVKAGETLGAIAKRYYGDAKRYVDIFEANRGTLDSPDRISVGQSLTIPHQAPRIA